MSDEPSRSCFLVDTHAHLSHLVERLGEKALETLDDAWRRERDALEEAGGGELPFLVDIGVDPEDFQARKRRFGALPWVRLAAGAWPGAGPCGDRENALAAVREATADPACVAVGECGLDYFHDEAPHAAQLELFLGQAEIARAAGKSLVVHSRDALSDTLGALREADLGNGVILHCFSYERAAARAFLDLGASISFAGNLTYAKSAALADALVFIPDERLLLETDAPYLAPEPRRGKPCSPLDVALTYAFAARLRDVSQAALERIVAENARRLTGNLSAGKGGPYAS